VTVDDTALSLHRGGRGGAAKVLWDMLSDEPLDSTLHPPPIMKTLRNYSDDYPQ
jgi:hypothetical protein